MKLFDADIWIGVIFITAGVMLVQLVVDVTRFEQELNLIFQPLVFVIGSSLAARALRHGPIRAGILAAILATLFQKALLVFYNIFLLGQQLLLPWFLTVPFSLLINAFYGFLGGCWAYYQLTGRKA